MKPTESITIRRKQIFSYLILLAFIATLVPACSEDTSDISEVREIPPNDAIAEQPIDAVFYENTEQCKQDLTQQHQQYQALQKDFTEGKRATPPSEPAMKPEDCEAQLSLALQEHEGHAPVYQSLEQCQAEGTECTQATENGGEPIPGYYPRFGGTFIYPYDPSPDFVYIYFGGIQHRVYRTTTAYRSATPGMLVTPYGRTIQRYPPGQKISVPQHTHFTAPARPSGTAASGMIRGRSSAGFGSTYKATGRGGVGK